jgi:hypothetical protein
MRHGLNVARQARRDGPHPAVSAQVLDAAGSNDVGVEVGAAQDGAAQAVIGVALPSELCCGDGQGGGVRVNIGSGGDIAMAA